MFNLIQDGLSIQRKIVDANHIVTDKEVKAIKDSGKSLFNRPDNLTNTKKDGGLKNEN